MWWTLGILEGWLRLYDKVVNGFIAENFSKLSFSTF